MVRLLLSVLFALGLSAAALGQTGTAVGVNPDAEAKLGTKARILQVGADVSVGEVVQTGPSGQVQMLFGDATKLVVGPGSTLKIEDYLLRQDNSAGKFAINALSGTFRFVTGQSPKDAYEIRTPTGTIGVRGTAFDFHVSPEGVTTVVLFHGAVRLCNTAGQCIELTDQCELGSYDTGDAYVLGNGKRPRPDVQANLPYVFSQAWLMPEFRVVEARKCLVTQPSGPSSGITTNIGVLEPQENPDDTDEPSVTPPPVTPGESDGENEPPPVTPGDDDGENQPPPPDPTDPDGTDGTTTPPPPTGGFCNIRPCP